MRAVCVFCGSSRGERESYVAAAVELGQRLVAIGCSLVYGGGNVGLMGVVADAVLAAGGQVLGVIPEGLARKELAHQGLTELRIVSSMHERKALMADRSDAFIALPGGYGTFEEFCEIITWSQLGLHRKPCGLLNIDGYYDPLLAQFERGIHDGLIRPQHRSIVLSANSATELLDQFAAYQPPTLEKWLDRRST